jgi:hypothetical protein
MINRIEIPLSKLKISLMLMGAIVFVILGILFTISPETFISPIFRNPQKIRLGGIVGVIFFGTVVIYGLRKLLDKTIGLLVDENGITDNTNASSVGLIVWSDITEIKTEQVMSTKFILIFTNNPDKYLDRFGVFKRKLMQGNMKMYGTPLSITSNTLKFNFADLEKLLIDKLNEWRETMPNR